MKPGEQFNQLTILEQVTPHPNSKWLCRCTCGSTIIAFYSNIVQGKTKSCGCHQKARISIARQRRAKEKEARLLQAAEKRKKARIAHKRQKEEDLKQRRKEWIKALKAQENERERIARDLQLSERLRIKEEDRRIGMMLGVKDAREILLKSILREIKKTYPREVVDLWKKYLRPFVIWSLANGYTQGAELIRKDPSRPYSPGNCQWVVWDDRKF